MRVGDVIAEVMKRERIKTLFVYPLTPLTEYAAAADIRPIVVRQERVGCAMADAGGRLSSSDDVKVFALPGRSGDRERVRGGGPGLLRRRAAGDHCPGAVARAGQRPADLQRHVELPAHHQERGDGDDAGDDRAGAASRLHAGAEWAARSMPDRSV